jgi:hypothetical protein
VLAELASREPAEKPGRAFDPPPEWRAPPEWVHELDDVRSADWFASRRRLLVRHPRGFPVVDVRRHGTLQAQLESELAPYALRAGRARGRPSARRADRLERWLAWMLPYVCVRLELALGVSDRRALSRVLLEHRAELHVSSARLDIVLSLDELPIEIRLSGLDRTPGWIPAARRFVAFHFE